MRHYITAMATLLVVVGCATNDSVSDPRLLSPPTSTSTQMVAPPGRQGPGHPLGDATERRLISQVKAMYPPGDTALLERQLNSPTTAGMRSSNPKVQAVFDQIFARRQAWADSVAANQSAVPFPRISTRTLTVLLVDSLRDPSASAEIWHRTNLEPHDVILLPASHATSGALQAAIHGYGSAWRSEAQLPGGGNMRYVIHGERHLKSWTAGSEGYFRDQVAGALNKPKTQIAGGGSGHSFDIVVALTPNRP